MSDERGEMTPRELDELASAYLDGEATTEEAALVVSDPRLQNLVEELRAVRDLVGTPVEPPSDEVRDLMVAQALAHQAPVVSLERARRRLRPISPQTRVILAAAAVVAVIAMVGVTVFQQADRDGGDNFTSVDSAASPADRDGGDNFASEDSAASPEMADEPAMEAPAAALAAEPEPESAESPEESPMDSSGPTSGDAEMADAPAEAGELLMSDEEAVAPASPESPEDEFSTDDLTDDSGEAAPAMADEPEDVPTSEKAPLVFDTEADLVIHVVLLADELTDAQGTGRVDEAIPIDLMGCPLFPDEGIELLTRFDAVVEETEAQVSVYLGDGDLRFTQTTPPPDCELFNAHTFTNWPD